MYADVVSCCGAFSWIGDGDSVGIDSSGTSGGRKDFRHKDEGEERTGLMEDVVRVYEQVDVVSIDDAELDVEFFEDPDILSYDSWPTQCRLSALCAK